MIIKSIDLKNYRNYETLNLSLSEKANIIYGDNAQGKTNILEAMYVASTTKSHKGSKDKEIIRFGEKEAHIKMIIDKNNIDYRIDIHLKKDKSKGIAINGIPIKKAIDLLGIVNIVFFSPEDLNIIKDGPSERRKFINLELSQLNKMYNYNLYQYKKVLEQRNKLLKDIYYNNNLKETLEIWNLQLIKYGIEVIKDREIFINELNEIVKEIHKKLSGEKEDINVIYEPSVDIDSFENELIKNQDKDIRFGSTSVGPHKDDIIIKINDIDVRNYGSQGQQRTAALSLKLAEIELVKKKINDTPILLLDDVLSELDSNRQNFLMESIGGIQTVITCTGVDDFINNHFEINKMFKVINGNVNCEN